MKAWLFCIGIALLGFGIADIALGFGSSGPSPLVCEIATQILKIPNFSLAAPIASFPQLNTINLGIILLGVFLIFMARML
jgi:hypothetical protein